MLPSFDGRCGLVRHHLHRNPTYVEIYVFLNRDRNIIKLLQWNRTGFCIYAKRPERGTFERPDHHLQQAVVQLKWEELMLILERISLQRVRRRKPQLEALPPKAYLRIILHQPESLMQSF